MNTAEKLLAKVNVGDAVKRINPQVFGAAVVAESATTEPAQKAIRQNSKPLNKAEQMALDWLWTTWPEWDYKTHALTFLLANGVRYTPDIIAQRDGAIRAYEVKAMRGSRVHIEDDSAVKAKVAAALYPRIKFILVWYDRKAGQHRTQHVLP